MLHRFTHAVAAEFSKDRLLHVGQLWDEGESVCDAGAIRCGGECSAAIEFANAIVFKHVKSDCRFGFFPQLEVR